MNIHKSFETTKYAKTESILESKHSHLVYPHTHQQASHDLPETGSTGSHSHGYALFVQQVLLVNGFEILKKYYLNNIISSHCNKRSR